MKMGFGKLAGAGLAMALVGSQAQAATINKTLCVGSFSRTMSDGANVTFWGFGTSCMMGSNATVPGPLIEVGVGDTLNLTLSMMMMTPQESAPYNGHTIHLHGADVATS